MDIIIIETDGVCFSDIEKYLCCVSKGRQESVLRKSGDEQRVQSLVAGLLVRSELSRRTGVPVSRISFDKGPHGKPYMKDSTVQFSLSHTKGAVCAAFDGGTSDIGVDIELRSRRVSGKFRERLLSDKEKELVRSDEDIIRIWVRKEAFLKRTGIGIATDLRGADTSLLPDISVYEEGEYFVAAAGKDAAQANVIVLSLNELLSRFVLKSE